MNQIFVYGTLLSMQHNNRLLASSRLVRAAKTAPVYTLLDLGGCPGMIHRGSSSVLGEVWECDDVTLARVDKLEGHPVVWRRMPVELDDGTQVDGYILQRVSRRDAVIEGASWKAHCIAKQLVRDRGSRAVP